MRNVSFAVALVALSPAAASAVVTVHVDPGTYTYNGEDQVVSWEVYATNNNPSENERLNAFTLQLDMPSWTQDGIRFLIPPRDERGWIPYEQPTEHPYVFAGIPNTGPFDPSNGSDYNTVRLAGVIDTANDTADIGPGRDGLGKIDVFVPKDSPFWGTVFFEPRFLSFAGPGGEIISTVGQPGAWSVVPEPASLGMAALAAPLVLRRRRRTAD